MRSSLKDIYIVFPLLTIITVFSYLLYRDFTAKVDVGDAQQIGFIKIKRKIAQRKYANQVVWEDVEEDIPVYNYDTLRTAELSEAEIILNDKTRIQLDENSMIMLTLEDESVNINVSHGSLATNSSSSDKQLKIKSGKSEVVAGAGSLSVVKSSKGLGVSVKTGKASVKTGDTKTDLSKDEQAIIAGDQSKKLELAIKQIRPNNNAYILSDLKKKKIKFNWEHLPQNYRGFIDVSKNVFFETFNKYKIRKNKDRKELSLAPGSYYWRIRAYDIKKKINYYSEIRKFTIVNEALFRLVTPFNKQNISYLEKKPWIYFNWSKADMATSYKIIISKDKNLKEQVEVAEKVNNQHAVDNLGEGRYYWRVVAITNLRSFTHTQESPIYSFVVNKKRQVGSPQLLMPAKGEKIHKAFLEKKSLLFNWKKTIDIKDSEITIARDKNFSDIVIKQKTVDNFTNLKKRLSVGKYYWRVQGYIDTEKKTPYSEIRDFNILEQLTLELSMPANKAVISPKEDQFKADVGFAWERVPEAAGFVLQVAKDRSFSNLVQERKTGVYYNVLPDFEAGDYFWRVKMVDNGQDLIVSNIRKFSVLKSLPAPRVITPRNNQVVNMSDRDSLDLRWQKSDEVDYYKVGLYLITKKRPIYILSKNISGDEFEIKSLNKLDVGRFMWTLQAISRQKGEKTTQKSTIVKNYFTITLENIKLKPKILTPKTIYVE